MRFFFIFVNMFFLVFTCFGQDLELVESIDVDHKNIESALAKYVPYTSIDKKIIDLRNGKDLCSEEYPIIKLNYYEGVIAYTYGYGDVSLPALYYIKKADKVLLQNIIKNEYGENFYRITSFITMISDNTVLYSVMNPDTSMTDIRIFNTRTKNIKYITSIKNGVVCDYFKNELIIYHSNGNSLTFFSVDIESNQVKELKFTGLSRVYSLGENRYLVLGDNKNSGVYFIDKYSNKTILEKGAIGLSRSQIENKLIIFIGYDGLINKIRIYKNCFDEK